MSETVVFLPAGEYKLFFRIAHLSKWKGKCRTIEEIIAHRKYNASSLDVSVESGVSYVFDVNDDRVAVFQATRV